MEIKTKYNIGDEVYEVSDWGEYPVKKIVIWGIVIDEYGISYLDDGGCYSTEWHTASEENCYKTRKEAEKEVKRRQKIATSKTNKFYEEVNE